MILTIHVAFALLSSVVQNNAQEDQASTGVVRISIHPTMLVATAVILPAEQNENIHFGSPAVNHNEIELKVVNEVAQSSLRQGRRTKDVQPFGSGTKFLVTRQPW